MDQKALIINIKFSEALFKTHFTKGFRQTYLIPLPTSVAGIFGAMLGIERGKIIESFKDFFFGAKLLDYKGFYSENTTYIQYKNRNVVRGVATSIILNNPSYEIALAARSEIVNNIYLKLKNGIIYFPYGGQNDFFAENINIVGIKDVEETYLIENYAPQDYVEKIEWDKGTELQILPVKHKLSPNLNFYFIFKGKLKLKEPIFAVDGIGLYSLEYFYYFEN